MEYVPNSWNTKDPLPEFYDELDKESVMTQMAQAVIELNKQNIYAADLQFLVSHDGQVLLVDFGRYKVVPREIDDVSEDNFRMLNELIKELTEKNLRH